MTIAILGGYGAVGAAAARRLAARAASPLRIGGRTLRSAAALCEELGDGATAHTVDLSDSASVAAFCAGSTVVLNCAGPSYRVLDTVALAAREAGAHYVDVAGDLPLLRRLRALPPSDRLEVVSAGVMPGLTAILPLTLLGDDPATTRIDLHVGGPVRITPASAQDILLATGPDFGTPSATWRDGRVAPGTATARWHTTLPHFGPDVHALPYLTTETADIARHHGLGEVRQHSVYVSERIPTTLATAWADSPDDPTSWAGELAAAATADLAQHRPSYTILAERRDIPSGRLVGQRLLQADDPYRLSGLVAALTAEAALAHGGSGTWPAWRFLDAHETWSALTSDPQCRTEVRATSAAPL
ncbi:saccharopine dehydrogenase NADP-binding domain-containing protein [Lentzea albida]|uniref:Saccharopine dehydrogenase NADP binding domain-containing protein n=1 Tax=Lentzea albida TaxID=65499 RepID=A0A1H9WS98_9PSEU|nr:saccharopine dehydrogenase NADP-binding domain-containing protein [Lentzea albida]SES36681.1 Saccharopine dehydrogenase NADP binding domain-containing protein [Lentzea albida]